MLSQPLFSFSYCLFMTHTYYFFFSYTPPFSFSAFLHCLRFCPFCLGRLSLSLFSSFFFCHAYILLHITIIIIVVLWCRLPHIFLRATHNIFITCFLSLLLFTYILLPPIAPQIGSAFISWLIKQSILVFFSSSLLHMLVVYGYYTYYLPHAMRYAATTSKESFYVALPYICRESLLLELRAYI